MGKRKAKKPANYIESLYMNGLQGRMLRLPPPPGKKKELLLLYGHHASLERMFGLAEDLNQYGGVTLPDFPGFGGMQSFYKFGEKPTLDNLADYLASFIKLRYKRKRVTILGMSFGFLVATRMLQKHPELVKRVDVLVSIVGFVHKDDLHFGNRNLLRSAAFIGSFKVPALIVRYLFLRPTFIRWTYRSVADKHSKLKDADIKERDRRIEFEIGLWHANDVRTYMYTTRIMFNVDLCNSQVAVPVYHVAVAEDRYFDNHVVEQHMRVIFDDLTVIKSTMPNHAPTVVADASSAAPFIPQKLRNLLDKQ